MKNDYIISIIIPVKVDKIKFLKGFRECFLRLSSNSRDYEVLIVDDSQKHIFDEIHQWFGKSKIKHFRPERKYFSGTNNKLNSIEAAIDKSKGKYILLMDDDCRPNKIFINSFIKKIRNDEWDCFRCIIHYKYYGLIELMNVASILFINVVCNHKQFWGNIGFRKDLLKTIGFPNKNILFDELSIDLVFRQNRKKMGYFSDLSVEMEPTTTLKIYFEQRLRYAYENIAYPLRFSLSLIIIPVLLCLVIIGKSSMFLPMIFISIVTIYLVVAGFVGQSIYGNKIPKYTFLFTPLWFFPYPLFSWLAFFKYATGGIFFGGNRIRRVV